VFSNPSISLRSIEYSKIEINSYWFVIVFRLCEIMKDQFMADVIRLTIEHRQMYTRHHTTKVAKVVETTYYQVHGFNDDGL
jgi:hypothetical protein